VGDTLADWITVSEAARRCRRSDRRIREWIAEGKIEAKKQGKKWIISAEDLQRFSEVYTVRPPHEKDDRDRLIEQLQKENEFLKQELSEASRRSDTIILQLTQQLQSQQKSLEDMRQKQRKPFWKRWFDKQHKE